VLGVDDLSVNVVDLLLQHQHDGENYLGQKACNPKSKIAGKDLSREGCNEPGTEDSLLYSKEFTVPPESDQQRQGHDYWEREAATDNK
jgi:hypothetical protein